jgi:hypothetical protein
MCKTKADIAKNPCLSGAVSKNSKIATTAVARLVPPMPCSLALKGLHQNQHEWLLWLSVTRKVGHQHSDGGVEERALCLLCERAKPWQSAAAGRLAAPLHTKLTSDTYTFLSSTRQTKS